MKNSFLAIVFCLAIACGLVFAKQNRRTLASTSETQINQNEVIPDRTINFRVDPLGLLLGTVTGNVDFAITKHITVGPTASYFSASMLGTSLSGFGIGARANIYLSGDAISSGWLVGPSVGYSSFGVSAPGLSGSTGGFYVGAVAGYQWVWKNGLNLDVGLGANYYSQGGSITAQDGSTVLDVPFFHGITPTAEVSLGFAI